MCRIVVKGIEVRTEACTRCGDCVRLCPTKALDEREGFPYMMHPDKCLACVGCMAVCEANAIKLLVSWSCGEGGSG